MYKLLALAILLGSAVYDPPRGTGPESSYSPSLRMEALRVVSEMPQWLPGMQNGKPVRTQFVIPIKFKL